MADTKITDLTAGTPEAADFLPYVDVSDTTMAASGTTKKALAGVYSLTLKVQQPGGTPGEDEVQVYHSGSAGFIESKDGVMSMKRGTGVLSVDNSTIYTEFSGTAKHLLNTTLFGLANDVSLAWNSGAGASSGGNDIALKRIDVSVLGLTDASTGGGSLEFTELTAPAAGAANTARLYAEDNGSGKTRLVAKFADGSTAVVATQP